MRSLPPHSLRTVVRFTAWTTFAAILLLSYAPPALRPVSSAPHGVEHFAAFAFLGGIFLLGYPNRLPHFAMAILPCVGALELLQLLAPGRHARFSDFLINAIGAYTGLLLATWLTNIWAGPRQVNVNVKNLNDT